MQSVKSPLRPVADYLWDVIDHILINVNNPEVFIAFYAAALESLGYRIVMEHGSAVGMDAPLPNAPENAPIPPDLWIVPAESSTPCHIAVSTSSVKQVDAFYRAATTAGGADNGEPGERPYYHPGYYAAFVLDPDGNSLEVVLHEN